MTVHEIMNVEGDDVLHIHTDDVLSSRCSVTLENLSPQDIDDITNEINTESTSSQRDSGLELCNKCRLISYRPKRKPSAAPIAAQKFIKTQKLMPHTPKPKMVSKPVKVKNIQSLQDIGDVEDSDDTIIYTPPRKTPALQTKCKAIFRIHLVGIK